MGMARLVSLGIVTALIACLGITFYQVIAPFLMPLFLAAMIALLCQPVLRYFLNRCRGRRALAAGISTAVIVGSVMVPIVVTVLLGILQFLTVRDTATETGRRVVSSELREIHQRLRKASDLAYGLIFTSPEVSAIDRQIFGPAEADRLAAEQAAADAASASAASTVTPTDSGQDVELRPEARTGSEPESGDREGSGAPGGDGEAVDAEVVPGPLEAARRAWLLEQMETARTQSLEMMKSLAFKTAGVVGSTVSSALDRTVDLLGACVGALVALFVFTLALYYFLVDGPEMVQAAQALIPIERAHQQELMLKFAASVRAVVMATFLAAVGQGVATALALQCVGLGHFFLFAIIATFSALIPMAGTWLVWVPCAVWLGAVEGSWGSAVFLAAVGIGPIGMMDNVVRTWVLKNDTSLHPLLAFVSVLGGLQVMGLWGVFIGPIVACCLHSLIEIFNVELREVARAEVAGTEVARDVSAPPDSQTAGSGSADSGTADRGENSETAGREAEARGRDSVRGAPGGEATRPSAGEVLSSDTAASERTASGGADSGVSDSPASDQNR